MEFDYHALVTSTKFLTNLYFGLSGFTDPQLQELEETVEHICSEAYVSYTESKQINK